MEANGVHTELSIEFRARNQYRNERLKKSQHIFDDDRKDEMKSMNFCYL